jgi:transposase
MIGRPGWMCTVTASRRASGNLVPRAASSLRRNGSQPRSLGLEVLPAWLTERHVEMVAIESTGVYWKPVLYALEVRFECWLCNARHVKKVPGRETDLSSAEWLGDVAKHAMVGPSFVPPPPIRALRELTRCRETQIDARVAEIQRLEKVLQDAGIKLTSVASKVLNQSGRAMIEAFIGGDGERLAELAKGKLRPKIPALTEALTGHLAPNALSRLVASSITSTSATRPSEHSPRRSICAPRPSSRFTNCCCRCLSSIGSPSTGSSLKPVPT